MALAKIKNFSVNVKGECCLPRMRSAMPSPREKELLATKREEVVYCITVKVKNKKGLLMREEVQDRFGNTIYLTDERWKHIVKTHHQLNGHRAEVLKAIRLGKRTQDIVLPYKFYYNYPFKFLAPFKEIEVVVIFRWKQNQPNNFIVTAYPI